MAVHPCAPGSPHPAGPATARSHRPPIAARHPVRPGPPGQRRRDRAAPLVHGQRSRPAAPPDAAVGRRRSRGRVGPPRVAEPLVSRRPSRRTEPPPSDCPRRGRAHATPPPPGCCGLSPAGHPNRRLLLDRRVRKDEVDQAGPPDRAAGARRDRHHGHAAPEHPHPRRSPTGAPSRAGRDHCPPRGASQLSDSIRRDVGRRGQPRQRPAATPPSRIGSCRLPHLAAGRWHDRTPRQPEHAVHLKGQRARHARWPSALPCRGHHG